MVCAGTCTIIKIWSSQVQDSGIRIRDALLGLHVLFVVASLPEWIW